MSSTDVCTAVKDGRRCVLPRFHDASMNATPHEYASLDDPPAADLRELADQFTAEMFTNGFGDKAARLVLVPEGSMRDLGGWGRGPFRDRVLALLRGATGAEK
jgi:hypothetical protein